MSDQSLTPDTDDTEGHGVHCSATDAPGSPDVDDTEGHGASGRFAVENPKPVDGPDDTEGHYGKIV
jgi:hypothetical protein